MGTRMSGSPYYAADGSAAEVFISATKPGSQVQSIGRDAAILLSLALIGVLLTIAILGMRASRRTRRRRTASDPRRKVLGAWTEALERLAAGGVIRRPSSTSLDRHWTRSPRHSTMSPTRR